MNRKTCLPAVVVALGLGVTACSPAEEQSAAESGATGTTVASEPADPTGCDASDVDVSSSGENSSASGDIATNPEAGTGFREGLEATTDHEYSAVTANPLATEAACRVLADGGTAADALVTAQAMLGLVEPQSSGIGGGGYILYYDAETGEKTAIDGREVAPLAADENYLLGASPDAQRSGRSIGVPGIVAALDLVQSEHGEKQWSELFNSTRQTATDGFTISPRLGSLIAESTEDLKLDPEAADYFLDEGQPREAGETLVNPEYAETLAMIADQGAQSFYTGDFAADIVTAASDETGGRTPSLLTTADLAGYTPAATEALCGNYRDREVCSMPPSSSGGIAVLETLGMLNHADLATLAPDENGIPDSEAVHLISEAERLAYADRDAYVADPAFVDVPVEQLLDPAYLARRYAEIDPAHSMGTAKPGLDLVSAEDLPEHGTSHISIIDAEGNAASMTTSVEAAFGSFHMVNGFLLNNQLTDFSAEPLNDEGQPVANRVEPAKRPRSSMAPVLVFGPEGELNMALGSPGGSLIIQYVIKTLVQLIDWGADPQEAVASPNFGALNKPQTAIGGEHPGSLDSLQAGLEERGHTVVTDPMTSGLGALVVDGDNIVGGADPRREGAVLGR
ncbi:gamma-glutamyltransferase [Corynebacterium doosanense]|uniref:gamma-glutamyltransferase n=1 Tax=Corynebacterium doosanense TaxID=1121358 RepID=UPI0004777980|nr:gamma-glutamyltransferase [Corynebacterium doosanense]